MTGKARLTKLANALARKALGPFQQWPCYARRRDVALTRVLLGDESGLKAAEYARAIDNPRWPSTPLAESPYVKLLQLYLEVGDALFHPTIFRETAYYQNALRCIRATGRYYGATCEAELCMLARELLASFKGEMVAGNDPPLRLGPSPNRHAVRVRPILYSDCVQIVEGHFRLAMAWVKGERTMQVLYKGRPVLTPLEELVLKVAWTAGKRQLYQPIGTPEFGSEWVLVRRCTDRFAMMRDFLQKNGLMPPKCQTYLDIASSYGFFVGQMSTLGFRAYGVEHDPVAVCIGLATYNLSAEQVVRSDCVRFLRDQPHTYDVISCFSLLHHFILGRAGTPAHELMKLIDKSTRHVLFLDTGENHEDLYRESLHLWDPDFIEKWLTKHSSFAKIYKLGTDQDRAHPFSSRFSRTLFACIR